MLANGSIGRQDGFFVVPFLEVPGVTGQLMGGFHRGGTALSSPADHVCERLSELKARSGRSYEWLARRTHISKSSVQRYCTVGVPPTFGMVESIALACGANTDEIAELFRLWSRVG